jgi:tetratricopeptide repeat protein 8
MMGVSNAEVWNNLGLCCFYASQFDTALRCLENALLTGDDELQADVWYGPRRDECHDVESDRRRA